jgi:uncharacterized protein (DUF3084 family)
MSPTPEPASHGELTKLRSERTAAQAWVDSANDDVIAAESKLKQAQDAQHNAQVSLEEASSAYDQALRVLQHPVSLVRRSG